MQTLALGDSKDAWDILGTWAPINYAGPEILKECFVASLVSTLLKGREMRRRGRKEGGGQRTHRMEATTKAGFPAHSSRKE